MKTAFKFKEFIWLVETIHKAKRITFAEIQERWLRSSLCDGVELARSTFNRHRDAIQDMFGIYIECDCQNGYKYYIGNDEVIDDIIVLLLGDKFKQSFSEEELKTNYGYPKETDQELSEWDCDNL